MRLIRPRFVGLLAALSLLAAVPATVNADANGSEAKAAHSCKAGYEHATLPNGMKCLRKGQRCRRARSFQQAYHRYGFHCKRNRRLTYR